MQKTTDPQLISFQTLRRAIGWLGILLPFTMVAGHWLFSPCNSLQDSISHYYYTLTGDVFVGILCAVALFLFTYKGYERIDNIATSLAATCAVGIAIFPTDNDSKNSCAITDFVPVEAAPIIHYTCAALFFVILAMMSLFLFTKSKGTKTMMKQARNGVYKTCGVIILLSIGCIALYHTIDESWNWLHDLKPVFWLEWIALLAFGVSWLVKGEMILKDGKDRIAGYDDEEKKGISKLADGLISKLEGN